MAQNAEIKVILVTSGVGQAVLSARMLPSGVPGGKGKALRLKAYHTDKPRARQPKAYLGYAFRPAGGLSRSEQGVYGAPTLKVCAR